MAPSPSPVGPGTSDTRELETRYGRRRIRRPVAVAIVGVFAAAALAWLVWVALAQSTPPVSSRLLSFEIPSARKATATIQVDRTKPIEAHCRLQAKAADFSIVGESTLTIPADSPRTQLIPATLTTQRAATSVVLIGCTTAENPRPR